MDFKTDMNDDPSDSTKIVEEIAECDALNEEFQRMRIPSNYFDSASSEESLSGTFRDTSAKPLCRNVLSGGRFTDESLAARSPRARSLTGPGQYEPSPVAGMEIEYKAKHTVKLEHRIEYRGNGTAFLGKHKTRMYCVLKVFRDPAGDAAIVSAIAQESILLAGVTNACVLDFFTEILDSGKISHNGIDHDFLLLSMYCEDIWKFFQNDGKVACLALIRMIMYQLMLALCYLRDGGILHLNLRIANIRIYDPMEYYVRITNFTWAQDINVMPANLVPGTEKEARAPEVILGYEQVSSHTDMYGLAIAMQVLYYNELPWFTQCVHDNETIDDNAILQGLALRLGTPVPDALLEKASRCSNHYITAAGKHTLKMTAQSISSNQAATHMRGPELEDDHFGLRQTNAQDSRFLDLCQQMMCYDPSKRITPLEALGHAFFVPGQQLFRPDKSAFSNYIRRQRQAIFDLSKPPKIPEF